MGLKLYEISQEMEALDGLLDSWAAHHEGDITEFPLNDELERLEGERTDKLLNLAVWHKSLIAEAKAFSDELKRLQSRQKTLSNKAERIKEFIDYNMEKGEKLEDNRSVLSYRESSQIIIDKPIDDLPLSVIKITKVADKTLIKDLLKTESLDFAHIEKKQNLQIK